GMRHALPGRAVEIVDDHVLLACVGANALDLGVVFVTDDAHGVAVGRELGGGLLALDDPRAGRVDDLQITLATDLFEFIARDAVGADHQGPALDLVGQISGADASIRQVGLDAGVVDELPESGDFLPLLASVLGLVDRQTHAVAEAGALGDAHVGAGGGCRAHLEAILSAPACAVRSGPLRPAASSV